MNRDTWEGQLGQVKQRIGYSSTNHSPLVMEIVTRWLFRVSTNHSPLVIEIVTRWLFRVSTNHSPLVIEFIAFWLFK